MVNISLRRLALLVAVSLLLAAWPAPARGQDEEKEAQRPAREATREEEAAKAADQAEKISAPDEAEISYEEILADPDNAEKNLAYARSRIRRGDLKGAAATLERVLLVNPNLPRVRLLYAVVLYRLDNLAEARRELETLKGLPLPPELAAEAAQYRRAVDRGLRKTQLSGRLSLGFEYDTNRNAAPSAGQRLFLDLPINLAGNARARDDTSLLLIANLEGRRDLGTQSGHEIFGSATYYRAEQTLAKTLNLQAYSLQAGGVLKTPWAQVTPSLLFDHVLLAQTTYLRNRGASLRLDKRLDRRTSLYVELKDAYQDYSRTADIPSAPDRRGIQAEATAGAERLLNPRVKLAFSLAHVSKRAARDYNAFEREAISLSHSWLPGRGTFLISSFAFNYDKYNQPDIAVSRRLRRDETFRLSWTWGAPLTLIHPSLKDLLGTVTYEYYHALSSIQNFAYTNNKLAALITYRWALGF